MGLPCASETRPLTAGGGTPGTLTSWNVLSTLSQKPRIVTSDCGVNETASVNVLVVVADCTDVWVTVNEAPVLKVSLNKPSEKPYESTIDTDELVVCMLENDCAPPRENLRENGLPAVSERCRRSL